MNDEKLQALDFAETMQECAEMFLPFREHTKIRGISLKSFQFMIKVIISVLSGMQEINDRAVWYADNTRPKSYKFICSACMKTAYAVPRTKRIKGVGDVKRCYYRYCPNCGTKMLLDTEKET